MPSTPEVIGKYRIERFLASGGMGDIYLGRDPMLDRAVAIKLLREGFDSDELRERFEREARAAGRLSHPNIVTIYEFGLFEDRPFIAMEYVVGESLAALIRRREPMTLGRKLELIEGLCAGLAHAHRANIVHRDIKPANLIVDPEGSLKVLDFGIVKLAGSGLTHHGVLVGTVNYMSPEQIAGAPEGVDHRSDVFAVGAVFYEVLAYQRAFPGQMADVLYKIVHSEPEPISRLCPGLDPAIERAVNRCLDRSAERRYQDLATLRRELSRIRQRLDLESTPETSAIVDETIVIHTPSDGGSVGVAPQTPDRVSALLNSAQAAIDGRDIDRALLLCEQAAALSPADTRVKALQRSAQAARDAQRVEALLAEAESHLDAERLVEARVALDLLSASVDSPRGAALRERLDRAVAEEEKRREWARRLSAAMNRARQDLDRGALADARSAVDEALSLDPNNSGAATLRQRIEAAVLAEEERLRREEEARHAERARHLRAAQVALERDDLTAAGVALDFARELGAGTDLSGLDAAIAERRRIIARVVECLRQGEDRLARGELDEAGKLVDEALTLKPTERAAATLRARVTEAIEARREREAWLASALETARAALDQGDHDAALEGLTRARELDPDWPGLEALYQEAARRQTEALDRRQREAAIATSLASGEDAFADDRLDEASRHVEAVLRLDAASTAAAALRSRIDARREAIRAEEARRRAEEERAQRLAQIERAKAAFERGLVEDALGLLEPLASTAADEPGFAELLARARAEHARLEEERRVARENAERLAQAMDRSTRHLNDGAFAAARAAVEEALAVEPAHAPALALRDRIAASLEARVDDVLQAAAAHVAKGRHQKAIDCLERAGVQHPRLDAEMARIREAEKTLALERRVDEVLSAARGRFRRRSPEEVLRVLDESGVQHPRIEQEKEAARAVIAEAARRVEEEARARAEQAAREQALRAEAEREQAAREQAERERLQREREERERAQLEQAQRAQAQKELAQKELQREQAQKDQAQREQARKEQAQRELKLREQQEKAQREQQEKAQKEQRQRDQARQAGKTPKAAAAAPTREAPRPAAAVGGLASGPAGVQPAQWQRPAMLAAAALLVIVLGFLAVRQLRAPGGDGRTGATPPSQAANQQPAQDPAASPPPSTSPEAPATQLGSTNPPAPVVPPATADPAVQAQAAATRVGQLMAQAQWESALAAGDQAIAQFPNDANVQKAVSRLLTVMYDGAAQARGEAERANARERDAEGFAAADDRFQTAGAERRRRPMIAARMYWVSQEQFASTTARALTLARQAEQARIEPPRQTETPARDPEPETPPPSTQPAPQQTPAQSPAPQTAPAQTAPAPQPPLFNPLTVKAVIDSFGAAYGSRDINRVATVNPSLTAEQRQGLARSLESASSYELTFGQCNIQQEGADGAVATCPGHRRVVFRSGQRLDRDVTFNFTLQRRGNRWVITRVQGG